MTTSLTKALSVATLSNTNQLYVSTALNANYSGVVPIQLLSSAIVTTTTEHTGGANRLEYSATSIINAVASTNGDGSLNTDENFPARVRDLAIAKFPSTTSLIPTGVNMYARLSGQVTGPE